MFRSGLSLMRRPAPSAKAGIAVGVALVAAETIVVYPLRHVAPQISLGVVYVVGVLLVASVWGAALGVLTSVLSTATFQFVVVHHNSLGFTPVDAKNLAVLAILLGVSLVVTSIASVARSRAIEADDRRGEAAFAAETARRFLRTENMPSALAGASAHLAQTLGLPANAIELDVAGTDDRHAGFPLRYGSSQLGTLLAPAELPRQLKRRVRERVVPTLESVLSAAYEREAMGRALKASRDELRMLADEQAALRRVATVVARGVAPDEVFSTVIEEIGQLLAVDGASLARYERDRTKTIVASWGVAADIYPVGSRYPLGGRNLATLVFESGREARFADYEQATGALGDVAREAGIKAAVATPVVVEGRLWGVVVASSTSASTISESAEERLTSFTELLATAIANAESRAGLARLADGQAALRRVATLVAHGARSEELFGAVVEEVGRLLAVDFAVLCRFEPNREMTIVASWGKVLGHFRLGGTHRLGGKNVVTAVYETGRPVRRDGYTGTSGALTAAARGLGIRSSVGTPIVVEGRLWGVVVAGSSLEHPLPAETEARLTEFTDLIATAIANMESRTALAASRARVVAAADETRKRIERDVHDGIQQRLVSVMLALRAAQAAVPPHLEQLDGELSYIVSGISDVFDELREISRGIHPAILSTGGLGPALRSLSRRSAVPVELDLREIPRLPDNIEVAVYYVVSEALANVAKHAEASFVHVDLEADDTTLWLSIADDGAGGADPANGSGLLGLVDRIEALGGRLDITSPTGGGTTLRIEVPLEGDTSVTLLGLQTASER